MTEILTVTTLRRAGAQIIRAIAQYEKGSDQPRADLSHIDAEAEPSFDSFTQTGAPGV